MKKDTVAHKIKAKNSGLRATGVSRWGLREKKYLLFAGKIEKREGIHFLIEAFKQLEDTAKTPNNFKLVIVSHGEADEDYLKYLRYISEDRSNIVLIGDRKMTALKKLIDSAYLLVKPAVLPADREMLFEAMQRGLAVMVGDKLTQKEFALEDEFVFKQDSITDLRDRLAFLLNRSDKVIAAGKKAKNKAERIQTELLAEKEVLIEDKDKNTEERSNSLSWLWNRLHKKRH